MVLYPKLSPSSVYDALSYYFDHKTEIDEEIAEDAPDRVLRELREDETLVEESPGRFRKKWPFRQSA